MDHFRDVTKLVHISSLRFYNLKISRSSRAVEASATGRSNQYLLYQRNSYVRG